LSDWVVRRRKRKIVSKLSDRGLKKKILRMMGLRKVSGGKKGKKKATTHRVGGSGGRTKRAKSVVECFVKK